MNHVPPDAGTIAILSLMEEVLELTDRLRERLGQPTPHKGKPILTRLRLMEEYDRAEVCALLLAMARGLWNWEDNSETQDIGEDISPPSLTTFVAHLPLGVKVAAAGLDQLGSLMAAADGSPRPRDIAEAMRWGRKLIADLCAVAKGDRRLFITTCDLHSMIERGWVEVFEGKPVWKRIVSEVDGFTLTGLAFEAA